MDKKKKAEDLFAGGCNCSQAVFAAFASDYGYTDADAMKIALSFGAGMGRMQHTCGAVTGAYMALGLFAVDPNLSNNDMKKKSYALVQEFAMRFSLLHKTTQCRDLLGVDLSTHEGNDKAMKDNLFGTLCRAYVIDAVGIVEDLIAEAKEA